MRIIVVDDERLVLEDTLEQLNRIIPDAQIFGFRDSFGALEYLKKNSIDIAFLDIEMCEMTGLELAVECKKICPQINIIFLTGYSQYAIDALKLHVSGYLIKPVREPELIAEIENLRFPLNVQSDSRVRIQTFGNFEIFVDNIPLTFERLKCKEVIAYLIDRKGAGVTTKELAAVLWEDEPYDRSLQNRIHQVIFALMKVLKKEEIEDIIWKHNREIAIDCEKIDCDYYRAINGEVFYLNQFMGEYMSNYSWAEFTTAELGQLKK